MFSNIMGFRRYGGGVSGNTLRDLQRKHSTIHVVSTNDRRELFGMHRRDSKDESSTVIVGFKQRQHAVTLARGLEQYYIKHGTFPPRDSSVADLGLLDDECDGAYCDLAKTSVDAVSMRDLMRRLSGSGVGTVSVLMGIDTEDGKVDARWWDLSPDAHRVNVVRALDSNFFSMDIDEPDIGGEAGMGKHEQPKLLPKPTRPDVMPDDVNTGTSRLLGLAVMLYLVSMEALAVWAHFIVCSAGSPLCIMR